MTEHRLTDEKRQELIGLLPFSLDSRHTFTPKCYDNLDKEYVPSFTIRPFTKSEQNGITRILKDIQNAKDEDLQEYARLACTGWENLWDIGAGERIEFDADEKGNAKKDVFARLPATIVSAVFYRATKISGLIRTELLGLG